MPYDITTKDGITLRNIPDGISPDSAELKARVQKIRDGVGSGGEDQGTLKNIALGALKGATDIGNTLITPVRRPLNAALTSVGLEPTSAEANKQFFADNANPDSLAFKGGDLAASVAGTAGIGGAFAKGARALGAAPKIVAALESGGFNLGGAAPATARQLAENIATRIGAGAAVGGASAGLINPSDAGTGALIGGALPIGIKAVGEIGRGFKAAVIDPISNQEQILASALIRAVGPDKAAQVAAAMGRAPATPGVKFTAGQSSGNEGLLAMEDALRAKNPGGALNSQAQANRVALASPVRDLAQTPEAIAAAVEARKAAAKPLYETALDPANQQELTPWIKGQITQLLKRPSINEASRDAQRWALERGERPAKEGSLRALHDVKQSIDDAIAKATMEGRGGEVAALQDTKAQLLTVLEKLSPDYANARATYASMSRPINQMQIGETLKNKLLPATSGDVPSSLNASMLARALLHPDQLAKSATGFKGATLEGILTPEQMAMVKGVNSDASHLSEMARLGAGNGSATARRLAVGDYIGQNLSEQAPTLNRLMESLGGIPGVNVLTKGVSGLGNMVGEKINAKMSGQLEDMLASDPQAVSNLLTRVLQQQAPGALADPRLVALLRSVPVGAREVSLASP